MHTGRRNRNLHCTVCCWQLIAGAIRYHHATHRLLPTGVMQRRKEHRAVRWEAGGKHDGIAPRCATRRWITLPELFFTHTTTHIHAHTHHTFPRNLGWFSERKPANPMGHRVTAQWAGILISWFRWRIPEISAECELTKQTHTHTHTHAHSGGKENRTRWDPYQLKGRVKVWRSEIWFWLEIRKGI